MVNPKFKVNFFKPHTDHAKANMRLIILLAIIWAVCVFGFQFLLIAFNKPVPEANYLKFQQIWPNIQTSQADADITRNFTKITMAVLGKNIALKAPHKAVLDETLSTLLLKLLPEDQKEAFANDPLEYLNNNDLHSVLGLEKSGFDKLMYDLLPTSLVKVDNAELSPQIIKELPGIMELYLVHNRSFLTDSKFLGFPFHYWYTAQFLLILFVGLCCIYAIYIDRLNKKYDFPD